MDGNYQIKLKKIIFSVIQNKEWENFRDIHIDEFDHNFDSLDKREKFYLSLNYLEFVDKIIGANFSATLILPLKPIKNKLIYDEVNLNYIINNIDTTSPSLLIYPNNWRPMNETIMEASVLDRISYNKKQFHFKEVKDFDEYLPVIYVT